MKTVTTVHCIFIIKWRFTSQRCSYCRKSKVITIIKEKIKSLENIRSWSYRFVPDRIQSWNNLCGTSLHVFSSACYGEVLILCCESARYGISNSKGYILSPTTLRFYDSLYLSYSFTKYVRLAFFIAYPWSDLKTYPHVTPLSSRDPKV